MSEFLLIHGSCHGAWCWRDVIPALADLGHTARAIDLPSHGTDKTPVNDVTLDMYIDAILDAIKTPVVLVGHSMAGYPIAGAANKAPDKIAHLVYLCAYAPISGKSLVEMRKMAPRQPIMAAVQMSEDRQSFTIDPAQQRGLFYHDCPDEAVEYAARNLCPQAVLPQATPLTLGPNYDSVRKTYIRCADDQTIPPEYQLEMAARFDDVHHIQTSHSPFFADPRGLATLLDQITKGT